MRTPRRTPRRVYGTPETNSVYHLWLALISDHNARRLQDGENPADYPDEPVAYETRNFGWILSKPDHLGKRVVLVKY